MQHTRDRVKVYDRYQLLSGLCLNYLLSVTLLFNLLTFNPIPFYYEYIAAYVGFHVFFNMYAGCLLFSLLLCGSVTEKKKMHRGANVFIFFVIFHME